jgi:hypothetical protein
MFEANNAQTLVAQLGNLHSLYAHLTMEYLRLPLSCRKYLYGNEATSTAEARAMAEAKFILATTLQWKPSYHSYDAERFATETGGRESKMVEGAGEAEDELCPIWINFFEEMVQADRLLSSCGGESIGKLAVYTSVEPLLQAAEDKFVWLHGLAMAVARNGEFEPPICGIQLTESMIFVGWNRFCSDVAKFGLASALNSVRPVRKRRAAAMEAVHRAQSSQREYFGFVPPIEYRPWIPVLAANDFGEYHPECAIDSPCRRSPDFCPCKARGQECENWNCSRSGPWRWPCVPAEPQVVYTSVPSYGAGNDSVEDAWKAGDLCDGVVLATLQGSPDPLQISPTPLLQRYNALWESLTPCDHEVVWPTPSFKLRDLKADAGLPLSEELLQTMPWDRLIALKIKVFFLSGHKIPYDIGEYPVHQAVVGPKFATFDTRRMEALLEQMLIERRRWSYEAISRRTGSPDYEPPALGNDWLPWAVRDAIEELIECCCESLATARRAEIYARE